MVRNINFTLDNFKNSITLTVYFLTLYTKKNKMKSENAYIGDDNFVKFLEHYDCKLPLSVIKMRFVGAICSPNLELRPADVINSCWEKGHEPRLQTQKEADLFFKFFMGLWDEMFEKVRSNSVDLSKIELKKPDMTESYCIIRYNEIENGFAEGFWGGKSDLQIPAYLAQVMDSFADLAKIYANMPEKAKKTANFNAIREALVTADKMVVKTVAFIIENSVLPRIDDLRKKVN